MRILACTPDLFFSTRIRSTLERAGHHVRVADSPEEVEDALYGSNPSLAILDLGAFGWPWQEILQNIRDGAPTVPILAFGSHMNVEATKEAQALGAARVVAKSEFVNNMLGLVERYARQTGDDA